MKIFLIGYRCTGKSTIGKKLAQRLGFDFIDTDFVIEDKLKTSIAKMVEKRGWDAFRSLEKETLIETKAKTNIVIATGGGIILDPQNQDFIHENGTCIWLYADIETILNRLNTDPKTKESRPSLTDDNIINETKKLLEIRNPLYNKTSHFKIDTSANSPEEIVKLIDRRLP